MSANYQTIIEKDFSSGINKLAAEDAVPQGFVENMENMQPNAQGYVEKRKGYQAYAGTLPLRVSKAERTADGLLCLYFDEVEGGVNALDFSTLKPSPIIVYGQSSLSGFESGVSKYYSTFIVDPRVVLGTQTVLSAADVGAKSRDIFLGLGYNAPENEGTKDNEVVYADSLSVNPATFNVTIGPVSNLSVNDGINCFVYIKNHATVSGESWAATISPTSTVGSVHTYTILQAQHQLNTQNYITRFYTDDTGLEIFPDSLVVTGSTITAQFTDNDPTWNGQLRIVIASIPEIDVDTRAVPANTSSTVSFPIAADFAFFEVYQVNGSTLSRVFPDKIEVNAQTASVSITNNTASQANFKILWDRASVRTTKLCVQEWIGGPAATDTAPQLVLYGLNHEELYPGNPNKAGWVTHIDSYKSEGENYLIAGLGWNLFKAVYDASLPVRQPLLRVSVSSAVRVGPMFGPASVPGNWARDRISYSFTGGNEGWGDIDTIEYQQSTGWVKVKVKTPGIVKHTNGGDSPVDVEHDRLNLTGTSQTIHRGEWPIMQFEEHLAEEYLLFWVYNPNVYSADYDEDSVGEAGVFTDKVEFTLPGMTTYSLLVGDILESASFPQGVSGSLSCVSTVLDGGTTYSYFTGIAEPIEFPGGQVYTVRRTGRVLRLRDINNPSTDPYKNIVPGDVLALSDRSRLYRIVNSVSEDATGISVSFDGELGEATVTDVDSSLYKVGQWLVLSAAGRFSGEYQVKALPDTSTIILDSSNVKDSTTSVPTGSYIQGRAFELNYEDEFYDNPNSLLSVSVPLRWFPLENPSGSPRRVKHFESSPYTNQQFVRSVMAQDNMYFANYDDHLLKYDGVSLYRSGLVRWQPQVFATVDTGYSGKIIVPKQVSTIFTATTNSAIIKPKNSSDINVFAANTKIQIDGSSVNPFTVITVDALNNHVTLDKPVDITGLSNTDVTIRQYEPTIYRYYFRLTAYDANDNAVTSATTGSNEFQVVLTESAAIRLRLLGLPKFEQLNYNKIYVEVYRTKRNSVAPFYNITRLPIKFDVTKPYIDVIDTISDEALPAQPDDAVLTFLAGANLGNGLSQPPQAKYCTVTDNRLVLANIQDDPKIQVDIYGNPTLTSFDNQVFYLRKDGTTTTNDLGFELQTNGAQVISAGLNNDSTFTLTLSSAATFVVGEWLYLFHDTAVGKEQLTSCGWHKVTVGGTSVTSVTVQLGTAPIWTETTITTGNTNFTVGQKLIYSGGVYSSAPNQAAPGVDYYEVLQVIQDSSTGIYLVRHYIYPNKVLQCNTLAPGPTSFPIYLGTDYNYSWRNANTDLLYSAAARALLRLSNAINFSQSVSSSPWVFANAGLDLGGQTLLLSFPENSLTTTPEFVMPSSLGSVEYYGNGVKVVNGSSTFTSDTSFAVGAFVEFNGTAWVADAAPYTSPYHVIATKTGTGPYTYTTSSAIAVGATTQKFPSRVVISYPNYAEVFHRPFDVDGTRSDSIVDVNPADGQEITGVFPFFSESTFGAALKAASIIVFKTNSIYIVNPATRQSQQLETNGLGCTAPYSIAATREGLMFANEAGLYRLTRSLTVEPIGSYIDRLWREGVNLSALNLMQGHAYGVGRKYKVSVPRPNETVVSDAFIYDYTREDSKNTYGSWTRYTNHPATGWCNLLENAYFASTKGRVYQVLNSNSKFDYHDDGQAISGSTVFRALDFGDSAIRKRVLHLLVHYRIPALSEGQVDTDTATVSMGVNLVDNFIPLDTFKLDVPNSPDGLSTLTPYKQVTLRYAVRNPKSLYFQVKIEDTGLHTPLQVTGLSFRVTGLSTEGIREAAQTAKE